MDRYLVSLLRAVMNDKIPEQPPKDIDWGKLYALSDIHSVANIVCYGIERLDKEDRPSDEIMNRFKKAKQIVIGREAMQQYEIQGMLDAYESAGVDCVPLKGWWMKHLYPSTDMRSMCDVDVLVRNEDMERVPDIMNSVGFRLEEHGSNHDEYVRSAIISTEIHWELFVKNSPYHEFFSDVMNRLKSAEGKKHLKKMSDEDFYLHLLAHAAKHFDNGGTGLRTLLDIWLYNKQYGELLDKKYMDDSLKMLGLYDFDIVMKELTNTWFDEGLSENQRNVHVEVGRYILSAGAYGVKSNNVAHGIANENSKFKYLLKRFFPDREFLLVQFPILEKHPYLIVVCWGIRGFRSIFLRRERFISEMNLVKETGNDETDRMSNIMKLSGLKK